MKMNENINLDALERISICDRDKLVESDCFVSLDDILRKVRNDAIESCAEYIEWAVGVLGLEEHERYDGDEGPIERRVALALAKSIHKMQVGDKDE